MVLAGNEEIKMENQKLNDVLAKIATGTCSMYAAKQAMGDDLTDEIEQILRAATDKVMRGVCDHQDRMDGMMRKSYSRK